MTATTVRSGCALEQLQTLLARGFNVEEVDSTDTHLLLVLATGREEVRLALDGEEARTLFMDPGMLERVPLLA